VSFALANKPANPKINTIEMITSLHIKNFRGFRDLHLEPLKRVNLLTGPLAGIRSRLIGNGCFLTRIKKVISKSKLF